MDSALCGKYCERGISACISHSFFCDFNILRVDVEPDEFPDTALLGGTGGMPDTEKRVKHYCFGWLSMNSDAVYRELSGKRCGMRPLHSAAADGLVRDEPDVSPAPPILSACVRPSRNVGFVGIRNAQAQPVKRSRSILREMEHEFVSIGNKTTGIDRLEMAHGKDAIPIRREAYGFDPMEGVLKAEQRAQGYGHLVWKKRG